MYNKIKSFIYKLFRNKSIKKKLVCPKCGSNRYLRKKTYMNTFFKLYCLNCKKTTEFRIMKYYDNG